MLSFLKNLLPKSQEPIVLKQEPVKIEQVVIKQVAIFGGAHITPDDKTFHEAQKVAKALALAGYTVINGGGPGIMKAATIGAKEGGGKVIGVTFYPEDMPLFEGRDKTNPIDDEIKTNNYIQRTLTLMAEGQVFVVFKGGSGTISEFGMAWGLAKLYFGSHKPLILYGNFWKKIMNSFVENMVIQPEESKVYKVVDSPEGVITAIRDFETELNRGEHPGVKASINKDVR
jgi:uncharacterized protein (TIGR00730 family)